MISKLRGRVHLPLNPIKSPLNLPLNPHGISIWIPSKIHIYFPWISKLGERLHLPKIQVYKLLGGLEDFLFHIINGIIYGSLTSIFFRGLETCWNHQAVNHMKSHQFPSKPRFLPSWIENHLPDADEAAGLREKLNLGNQGEVNS